MAITSTNLSSDQRKYLQEKLISLAEIHARLQSYAESVSLPQGMGKTANFVKYNRVTLPMTSITEGTNPTASSFTISSQTVTVDQWGLFITLTDVSELTTAHAPFQHAIKQVAEAANLTREYNLANVVDKGTNVQYWDGSLATRVSLTTVSSHYIKASALHKARVTLQDAGAPEREGMFYVAVCSPAVIADVLTESATDGTSYPFASAQNGAEDLKKGVVKDWLGFRFVKSNFLPEYTLLAGGGAATPPTGWTCDVSAGSGITATVYYKVTRKANTRGFEETITTECDTGAIVDKSVTWTAPATTGYVYNIYAGTSSGDANLYLVKENLAPSGTFTISAAPSAAATPPATPLTGMTVHPIFIFASEAVDHVKLEGSSIEGMVTPKGPVKGDELALERSVGAKWMSKAGIRDQNNVLRLEVVSRY